MGGKGGYAPPELVKYRLAEGVGQQTVSASNTRSDCSCDCVYDFDCVNVGDQFSTPCDNDTGVCVTSGGDSCP